MEIKKLKSMPYAQAHVEIVDDNNFYLFSYTTLVCSVEDGWLTVHGLHSMTTRKHISAFMREYCETTYQVAKDLYQDGYSLNLEDGEVVAI